VVPETVHNRQLTLVDAQPGMCPLVNKLLSIVVPEKETGGPETMHSRQLTLVEMNQRKI